MINALLLLVALLVGSASADAEIFKCVNEKRVTVYQNFPCELDSRGLLVTTPPPQQATEVRAGSPDATGAGRLMGSKGATASATADGKAPPRIGMSRMEVRRQSWGRPARISRDPETKAEIWTYDTNGVVWFDKTGHVAAIQR
jgi:hypothetical protein